MNAIIISIPKEILDLIDRTANELQKDYEKSDMKRVRECDNRTSNKKISRSATILYLCQLGLYDLQKLLESNPEKKEFYEAISQISKEYDNAFNLDKIKRRTHQIPNEKKEDNPINQ